MKLSVVGPTYPFRGGISHYTSLLVRTLRSHHELQFLSYSRQYPTWLYPGNNDRDPSSSFIREIPDEVFDALNPWAWRQMTHRIGKHQARLVILPWSVVYWSPYYYVFINRLKKVTSAAVLFICHNVIEHEPSWLKSFLSQKVISKGDRFITHSHWDKANLRKWIGSSRADQIWVNPHPIYQPLGECCLTKAEARAKLGVKGERVLLFFGFIREYKGLRYLLESLPLVLKYFPVHLLIAGEVWGESKTYADLIRNLNLQDYVTFEHQYIPNEKVEAYFAAADLVVIPYVSASQSGIVQLAFGYRKPIIVGKVGGLTEVVEDRKTGYLVTPRDPAAIAQAVLHFYETQCEKEMVGNIELGLSRFSWERMAETIENISTQLPSGANPGGTKTRILV